MWTLKTEVINGWPPLGWTFYQPECNWQAPNPLQNNFTQTVHNIILVRQANPQAKLPTDYDTVAAELIAYTVRRLHNHLKWCVRLPDGAQKKTTFPPIPKPSVAEVAAEEDRVDPSALFEWLGAGGRPVQRLIAETRASVCLECPKNSESPNCPPDLRLTWRSWWTKPVAKWIRGLLSLAHQLKLHLPNEEQLGKCLACKCELKLKPWVPIEHLLDNTPDEVWGKLDPRCWVLKERDQVK